MLLIIKTTAACFEEVKKQIQKLHEYEVPEIVAFTIDDGLPSYLDWLGASVTDGQ